MNTFQRTVKYAATAFAIFLAICIISSIVTVTVNVISAITGGTFWGDSGKKIDVTRDFSELSSEIRSLDIKNLTGELYIKTGDTFEVDGKNVAESFRAQVSTNGTLYVSENKSNLSVFGINFGGLGLNNFDSKITITLPEEFIAETVKLDNGAGDLRIDTLHAGRLIIETGAGDVKGSKMTAEEVDFDGGLGNVTLSEVDFSNTVFDCGMGNLNLDGRLTGRNKIECGMGNIDLDLTGSKEDFNIKLDAGVGKVRINGNKFSREINNNGDAENDLNVNGGIGNVKIDFKD